jgi:CubicO group peptidase (beta-lactamase class C family)
LTKLFIKIKILEEMKNKLILCIVLFLASLSTVLAQSKAISKKQINELDAYFEQAQKKWNVPGMAIAIVQNGDVVFSKAYGVKNIKTNELVDENTLFAIASNTKAFTSAALSILVAEGRINWDDKVQKYLPYFKLYSPYISEEMTIRDLLCHRSGLKTFSGDLLWYGTTYSRKEIIERARFLVPTYGFRERYGYSNIMFLVAGEIIPVVTGLSWDDFIVEKIFKPLGMNNSNTSISKFNAQSNLALPHHVVPGEETKLLKYINWDNIAPAGAINSSVAELSNWMIMQLNNGKFNGKQILDSMQIWEMRKEHTSIPLRMQDAQMFPSKHFHSYGLGWDLFDYNGRKIVNHGGGADGMISKLVLVPEEKLGFVILTNSINYLPTAIMYQILDAYTSTPRNDWSSLYYQYYERSHAMDKQDAQQMEDNRNKQSQYSLSLESYTGVYGGDVYGDVNVGLENGKLVLKLLPTPMFIGDLEHYQYNTFSISLRDIINLPKGTVNFILDAQGKVSEMVLDIPNPDFDFTELKFYKR